MESSSNNQKLFGTTIVSVRKGDSVVIAGDGQVTIGTQVIKSSAKKVRRIGTNKDILVGFAGATADAFTLLERLESNLEKYSNQLMRACVELVKDFRTDKYLRKLESMMLVADRQHSFTVTGAGDVLEPEDGIMSIGSGGTFALAAARALALHTQLDATQIAMESLKIASELCIYTNDRFVVETLKI
ncbi:MAG: ATP-dependent protease subunit HslV [Holosporales bacterium]|jgi:ATP-dependent HslUV protease subunit HslV|nr:ATP-dependent protease subunit HslV [Holosporales bacterium]